MHQWNILSLGSTSVKIYESTSGKTIIMPVGEIMFRKDENDPADKYFFVDGLNNNILERISTDEMVSPPFSGTLDSFLDSLAPIAGAGSPAFPDPTKADLVSGKVPVSQLPDDVRMLCFSIESDLNLTSGVKNLMIVPYDCTIVGWDLIADSVGSVVLDVWRASSTVPTAADTITGTEKPTLSSQQINSDDALTTWSTSLTIDDVLAFYVETGSTVKKLTLKLKTIKI